MERVGIPPARVQRQPAGACSAMTMQTVLAGVVALLFAAVHLFGGRLRFLAVMPRSAWLSAAGGVSVAYVFVHVLPELAASQRVIAAHLDRRLDDEAGLAGLLHEMEAHSYVIALAGLALFFGLERFVSSTRRGRGPDSRARAGGEVPTRERRERTPSGSTLGPMRPTTHSSATCCSTASKATRGAWLCMPLR
jgi:hypothetical protein